jgi:hypothetical protein
VQGKPVNLTCKLTRDDKLLNSGMYRLDFRTVPTSVSARSPIQADKLSARSAGAGEHAII